MGWGDCGFDDLGRSIGYSHPGLCDYPDCGESVDRGLDYACGNMHGIESVNGYPACPRYFCAWHWPKVKHDCPTLEDEPE